MAPRVCPYKRHKGFLIVFLDNKVLTGKSVQSGMNPVFCPIKASHVRGQRLQVTTELTSRTDQMTTVSLAAHACLGINDWFLRKCIGILTAPQLQDSFGVPIEASVQWQIQKLDCL